MGTRKVFAYGPGVMFSGLVTVMLGALLPPLVGLVVFAALVVLTVAVLSGVAEDPAVRVLGQARSLTAAEVDALAPAVGFACRHGAPVAGLELRVRESSAAVTAYGVGRRTVVVTSGLVQAVRDGRLPVDQAAAVLTHGAAAVVSGAVRADLALELWTLPWQIARGILSALTAPFRRSPLLSLAWKGRFVVATIAGVQASMAGQVGVAVVIVTVCALTYLTGRWERAWARALVTIGDTAVREAGLGDALARFLLRRSRSSEAHERAHALFRPAHRALLAAVPVPH